MGTYTVLFQVNYASNTNSLIGKRLDLWLPEVRICRKEFDEGVQNAQTSSYKKKKYWRYNAQHKAN